MAFGKADSTNGYFGGDVRNRAILTLSEDFIEDGSPPGTGGGISNDGGMLTLTHSLVWNNSSTQSRGRPVGGIGAGSRTTATTPWAPGNAVDRQLDDRRQQRSALGGGVVNCCAGATPSARRPASTPRRRSRTRRSPTTTAARRASPVVGCSSPRARSRSANSIVASNSVTNPSTGDQSPSNCGAERVSRTRDRPRLATTSRPRPTAASTPTGDHQNTDPSFLTGGWRSTAATPRRSRSRRRARPSTPSRRPRSGCSGTDQRDFTRPQGTGCDIGAYELFQPVEGTSSRRLSVRSAPEHHGDDRLGRRHAPRRARSIRSDR